MGNGASTAGESMVNKGESKGKGVDPKKQARCFGNKKPFSSLGCTRSKHWKKKVERNVGPTLEKQELWH